MELVSNSFFLPNLGYQFHNPGGLHPRANRVCVDRQIPMEDLVCEAQLFDFEMPKYLNT